MFATVLSVGVCTIAGRKLLPLLFVRQSAEIVKISSEAFEWAVRLLGIETGLPHRLAPNVGRCIAILARFVNFVGAAFANERIAASEVDYAITAYVLVRHVGTDSGDTPERFRGLGWKPATASTVRAEFEILSQFVQFCAAEFQYAWPLNAPEGAQSLELAITRLQDLQKQSDRDFFVHLAARRLYWEKQKASSRLQLPKHIYRHAKQTAIKPPPEPDAVEAIIRGETNPCFRAIFIAGAFGGLRISEQLNSWQVDHRPGTDSPLFFGTGWSSVFGPLPLYLRTHPAASTYITHPQKREDSRQKFLQDTYGLRPRNLLPREDPLYAGWKGTVAYGLKETHLVIWADPHAALMFEEAIQEIFEFHRRNRTSRRHPWFFVNLADKSGIHLGNPLKIKRIEHAFDAAVMRVGLEPHTWGHSLHGLRHFYKRLLETRLKLPERSIQIAMGHSSIRSQNDYNRELSTVSDRLRDAFNVGPVL